MAICTEAVKKETEGALLWNYRDGICTAVLEHGEWQGTCCDGCRMVFSRLDSFKPLGGVIWGPRSTVAATTCLVTSQDIGREPVWELACGRYCGTWVKSLALGLATLVSLSHSNFL